VLTTRQAEVIVLRSTGIPLANANHSSPVLVMFRIQDDYSRETLYHDKCREQYTVAILVTAAVTQT